MSDFEAMLADVCDAISTMPLERRMAAVKKLSELVDDQKSNLPSQTAWDEMQDKGFVIKEIDPPIPTRKRYWKPKNQSYRVLTDGSAKMLIGQAVKKAEKRGEKIYKWSDLTIDQQRPFI